MQHGTTLIALAFLFSFGCGGAPSNPCKGQPGECLIIEAHGNIPKLDVLQVSVRTVQQQIFTGQTTILPAEIVLPAQFPVLLPASTTGALDIKVAGIQSGVEVAAGEAITAVPPFGQRIKVEMTMLLVDGGTVVDFARNPIGSTDMAVPRGSDLAVPPFGTDLAIPPCVPTSCNQLGVTCGTPSDGCGKTLSCGPACGLGTFSSGGALNPGLTAFGYAQVGKFVYLFGGSDSNGTVVATVQRATIGSDGSLGPFAVDPGVMMTSARFSVAASVVDGFMYLTGGATVDPTLGTVTSSSIVERATIASDGSIGSFSNAGVSLVTPRDGHAAVVAKNVLYVIGGQDSGTGNPFASVESAPIMSTGALGLFTTVANPLTVARTSPTALVTPSFLYVLAGGGAGTTIFRSIERASIDSTGALTSTFADSGVELQTARYAATTSVIGGDVYVVGGEDLEADLGTGVFLNTMEHATIGNTLSSFSLMSQTLATPRDGHGAAVTGNSLYIIGGFNDGMVALTSIERARLQ